MTTITCVLALLLGLLTIPAVILWRCTLTKQQHARRLRNKGWTYNRIAQRLNTSPSTARRWATA